MSALDAKGGGNMGQFGGGVIDCGDKHGPAPGVAGLWETTPPTQSAPAPAEEGSMEPPFAVEDPKAGPQPKLDSTDYVPGQWLTFETNGTRQQCTAGFVVEWNGLPYGLSAGHCSGRDSAGTWRYGSVFHEVGGGLERLGAVAAYGRGDSLLFGELTNNWRQQIERPGADLNVTDFVTESELAAFPKDTRVCFAGRLSGPNKCEKLVTKPGALAGCIDVAAKDTDSGGPVYTVPVNGTVRAIGILSGNSTGADKISRACFTSITAIMTGFACADCVKFPTHTSGAARKAPLVREVDGVSPQRRRKGLRVVVRLSRPAVVTLQVQHAAGTRWHVVRRRLHSGRNVVRISRLGRSALRRGTYQIAASARAGSVRSTSWELRVRLR